MTTPVNCVVSDWSDWRDCSKTCDTGVQTRKRTIITPMSNGGTACPKLDETQDCNTQKCTTTKIKDFYKKYKWIIIAIAIIICLCCCVLSVAAASSESEKPKTDWGPPPWASWSPPLISNSSLKTV